MGVFETLGRLPKILEANINDKLNKVEEKYLPQMIDQAIIDAKKDLADVKRDTVDVMADFQTAERNLNKHKEEIAKYEKAIEKAAAAGDLDAARKMIEEKQRLETTLVTLQATYETHKKNADMMQAAYNKLVSDVQALEARKDAAKAAHSLAKAQTTINRSNSVETAQRHAASFGKYEEMANRALDRANAEAKLNNNVSTASQLADQYLSGSSAVDDELAKVLAKVNGGQ